MQPWFFSNPLYLVSTYDEIIAEILSTIPVSKVSVQQNAQMETDLPMLLHAGFLTSGLICIEILPSPHV
jgi:hypothetical protein